MTVITAPSQQVVAMGANRIGIESSSRYRASPCLSAFRQLIPGVSNADVIAAAIVAAADVYGDDPVLAVTGRNTQVRCVAPAMSALCAQHGDEAALARMLGRSPRFVRDAQKYVALWPDKARQFDAAEPAAREALTAMGMADDEAEVETDVRPPPPPHAEIARSVVTQHKPTAGPISAPSGNAFIVQPAAPARAGSLPARILEALADGAHTACGMASRLGEKELLVEQTLKLLRHEGRVGSDPPEGATRGTLWRLARSSSEAQPSGSAQT